MELKNKLDELEQKLETTSKDVRNKLKEIETKMESNFETTSTQLKEILKILKPKRRASF